MTTEDADWRYDVEDGKTCIGQIETATGNGCCKKHKRSSSFGRGVLAFGLVNFLWFLFRTGTRPSRICYPCQRAALSSFSLLFFFSLPLFVTSAFGRVDRFLTKRGKVVVLLFLLGTVAVNIAQIWYGSADVSNVSSSQEFRLNLESANATAFPASDVYVVNGRISDPVHELVDLMGVHGLRFYRSNVVGVKSGSDGLVARDDIVLVKINEQWSERGGTNTDILKELIEVLVEHPDGFVGEIVVADNGQGFGSMNWPRSNAENITQSTQTVVDMFSSSYNVSTYDWQPIRGIRVNEYSDGDDISGYVRYENSDPQTGIYVSYPKFQTKYGTRISFKHGIWNGTRYEERLKIMSVPVLKTHWTYGVTGCLKHYMGVQSEGQAVPGGLANGHETVANGGMGTLMIETRFPTLNILDATWINARPMRGPRTYYDSATRVNVLMASVDPAALDHWAAKHVLMQTSRLMGFSDVSTMDPDGTGTGLFKQYLNNTLNVLTSRGYNNTVDENRTNVFVFQAPLLPDIAILNLSLSKTIVGEGYCLVANVTLENQGVDAKNLNLTVFANSTIVGSQMVFLEGGNSTIIAIVWNTTGLSKGDYLMTAFSQPLADELDVSDNNFTRGPVHVVIPGDVNGDERVNMKDIAQVAKRFLMNSSDPLWNPNIDINNDGKIDGNDLDLAVDNFGSH